jgi:hypothetical protein
MKNQSLPMMMMVALQCLIFLVWGQPDPGPFNPPLVHLHGNVVEDDEDQEEWDNWMPHEPDVAPAADQTMNLSKNSCLTLIWFLSLSCRNYWMELIR